MTTVDINRRGFLAGLGAAIAVAAIPTIIPSVAPARVMPRIVLQQSSWGYGGFTEAFLRASIKDIYSQVEAMAYLQPTAEERQAIADNADEVLNDIRPVGLLIKVEAPMDKMARGEFTISEPFPWSVLIS